MKKVIRITSIAFLCLSFSLTLSLAIADGSERAECEVCGMYIDQYQKTAGRLEYKTGEIVQSCGLACLLRQVDHAGGPDAFKSLMVKDWFLGLPIPAEQATYVISSKIIPDMLPNIIAFDEPSNAEKFLQENGGEILTFTQALLIISPTSMTMPARLKTAVLPPQGGSGVSLGVMTMTMDTVKIGSDSVDPGNFIKRQGQMMGPKKMETQATMLMANYGITDNMAIDVKASYLDKKMEMYTMNGAKTVTKKNNSLSDTLFSYRYNIFKTVQYNHFASVLVQASLPTGDFDKEFIMQPGLQTGTGDFTFGGGLLYTYRYQDLWMHTMASYTHNLENSDNYKFGDEMRAGLAVHYTPNYDFMLGLETDIAHYNENDYNGNDIGNTGGVRSNLTGVASWKFLTALGGNFNLHLTGGLPLYEDLNHVSQMGAEAVQLGGGWFGSVAINFSRRYAPHQ